jgi:hypothetical protein
MNKVRWTMQIIISVALLALTGTILAGCTCVPPGTIPPACQQWYDQGKEDGTKIGYDQGYNDGQGKGYNDGYDKGYNDGKRDCPACPSCQDNYQDGYRDGWNAGVQQCWGYCWNRCSYWCRDWCRYKCPGCEPGMVPQYSESLPPSLMK